METPASMEEAQKIKWIRRPACRNEGDTDVAEPLEHCSLGGVSGRRIADEGESRVALAGAGGDDVPADVSRPTNHQHPAPLLLPGRGRHLRGWRAKSQAAASFFFP